MRLAAQQQLPSAFSPFPTHPLYTPLARWRDACPQDWPRQQDFDALVARAQGAGQPLPAGLRFACDLEPAAYYEMHIARHGEVPTRTANWHDWFNALAWLSWPRAKAALNARHVRAIERGEVGRGPLRDAATLLDECGVILPCADAALAAALRGMAWRDLFVHARAAWGERVDALALGHALFEQGLAMHRGWCGKALLVEVEPDFFRQDAGARVAWLDAWLAQRLDDDAWLSRPRELLPLPLLGIPGWWDANRDEAYYDDSGYFRSTRRANSASVIASS